MVYSVASSILEIPKVRKMPYVEVYRYLCYKKFDNWLQKSIMENQENG